MSPKQTNCNGAWPPVVFLPRLYDAFPHRNADVRILSVGPLNRSAGVLLPRSHLARPLPAETTATIGLRLLLKEARLRFAVPSDCLARHRALSDKSAGRDEFTGYDEYRICRGT